MDKKNLIPLIYVIGLITVIIFLTTIFKRVGIFKSKKTKDEEKKVQKLELSKLFDPLYSKGKAFKKVPKTQLQIYAKDIRKSVTKWTGTDEEIIYSSFAKLYNKLNISELAAVYYEEYEKDLRADIFDDLNDKEKAKLQTIIDNLPNF